MRLSKKRAKTLVGLPHKGRYICNIEDLRKIYKAGLEDGLDAGQCSYRLSQRLDKMQREGAQKCHGKQKSKKK